MPIHRNAVRNVQTGARCVPYSTVLHVATKMLIWPKTNLLKIDTIFKKTFFGLSGFQLEPQTNQEEVSQRNYSRKSKSSFDQVTPPHHHLRPPLFLF